MSDEEYYDAMIEAFVDKPSEVEWYKNAFSKFNVNGVDTLKWHWSWWAFGGGFLYLLYRKAYLPALILFILSISLGMIPFASFALMILSGGLAPYFVYKRFKTKLKEIEENVADEQTRIETMREVGGYHQWVIWVYATFMLLFFGAIISAIMSSYTLA